MASSLTGRAAFVAAACALLISTLPAAAQSYTLDFASYFGGNAYEHARDIFADAEGNIYMVGGTRSLNFPATPGAYDTSFNGGGGLSGEEMDAFAAKFNRAGQLQWCTYLGSPNYDRAYAVEVDAQGYVYVAGRASIGFPTTAGAFQPDYQGQNFGGYGGPQNGFVAKLTPDGSGLVWASYAGTQALCRDLALDADGGIYLPCSYSGSGPTAPAAWLANAYQNAPRGGSESGVMKVRNDGTAVEWATYMGGTGYDSQELSIRVDANKNVYMLDQTASTDMPTTPGVVGATRPGGSTSDLYLAKVSPDGSQLLYGTYVGGNGEEWLSTHNLALDAAGNAYVTAGTSSTNWPTTPGAFQPTKQTAGFDWAVAKISSTGALLAGTYIGNQGDGGDTDGVYVDGHGNVVMGGIIAGTHFPVTADAYQSQHDSIIGGDAALGVLEGDLSGVVYATYLGGAGDEYGRTLYADAAGNLYIAGQTTGAGWPAVNAVQGAYQGGQLDTMLARFTYIPEPGTLILMGSGSAMLLRKFLGRWWRASGSKSRP